MSIPQFCTRYDDPYHVCNCDCERVDRTITTLRARVVELEEQNSELEMQRNHWGAEHVDALAGESVAQAGKVEMETSARDLLRCCRGDWMTTTITTAALAHLAREVLGWAENIEDARHSKATGVYWIDNGVFRSMSQLTGYEDWRPYERTHHAVMLLGKIDEDGGKVEIENCGNQTLGGDWCVRIMGYAPSYADSLPLAITMACLAATGFKETT